MSEVFEEDDFDELARSVGVDLDCSNATVGLDEACDACCTCAEVSSARRCAHAAQGAPCCCR